MIQYCLRPGYRSSQLLIEFTKGVEKEKFLSDLIHALKEFELKVESIEDLWMNDEQLVFFNSSQGSFALSIDIWGFAFITSSKNQPLILKIAATLAANPNFKKEVVNFKDYQ